MPQKFSDQERSILERLDAALRRKGVKPVIETIAARVEKKLLDHPAALLTWEPIPLDVYSDLPAFIRSSWVFVLRAGSTSGAERHPNSQQRMISWRGVGDIQTCEDGRWRPNVLIPDPAAPLKQRWVSIPANVWHKPVMGEENWVVVSFHTALARELIEERGDPTAGQELRRKTYL